MSQTLERLLECVGLKALPRAGWVARGVPAPESVAAHSWGVAWLVMTLLPDDLDRGRALAYATLHDLPEVRVGDLVPADGVSSRDKHAREDAAMVGLSEGLGDRGPGLVALWRAYEAQGDPEARFVRQLDRLDMALQAVTYAAAGAAPASMSEFIDSAAEVVTHPVLAPLLEALRGRLGDPP